MEMRLHEAVDRFMGDFARRTKSADSKATYRRILNKLCDEYEHKMPAEITKVDCQRFLDQWQDASSTTMALHISILNSFFRFLEEDGHIDKNNNPMDGIKRPKLVPAEDRDVVTVSTKDVERMFRMCEDWQEILCLSVVCYLGPRRTAASNLRWGDIDLERGIMRFKEKGSKVIWKPIPDRLREVLTKAVEDGVKHEQDDYVIPNRHPNKVRSSERRSNKIIWNTVRRVAKKAGIHAHPHSLRAAFAVKYLDSHPGDIEALKHLMGHSRYETTAIYLRRYEKMNAMERVRDLDWGGESSPTVSVQNA